MKNPIIDLVYFDAGGGHRNAMEALSEVLQEKHPTWEIRPLHLQDVLRPVDPVYHYAEALQKLGISKKTWDSEKLYNDALKKGKTGEFRLLLTGLQTLISAGSPILERGLRAYWKDEGRANPDLVVSMLPNFNRVLYRALKKVHPDVPYVTIMTDIVDVPPHFWMEPQDQAIICGSPQAKQQAVASGFYKSENIFQVSGMILKKAFYQQEGQSTMTLEGLGLDPAKITALIMFGGNGSMASVDIVESLSKLPEPAQAIVMCGKNEELYSKLSGRQDCHPVGFTRQVPDYMRLADFFIGKPGPGSMSEALHCGCPLMVEDNNAVMPQERPNIAWMKSNHVGLAVASFTHNLTPDLQKMIDELPILKENIRNNLPPNRAVMEIADILPRWIKPKVG